MTNKPTLVICTCDSYEDAWYPLFTLFKKYWKEFSYKVVINTETKTFNYEGFDIHCPRLYRNNAKPHLVPWSKRLKETLIKEVDTELVLLYLDDFYLQSNVDVEKLYTCIDIIEKHDNIANIQLFPCPSGFRIYENLDWLVQRNKKSPYIFNLQAGLWRKERLIHFLRDHESPWYFERWGSIRARRYNDIILSINPEIVNNRIFDYNPSMIGLSKGYWLPETKEFFEKENILIDTQIRGILPKGYKFPSPKRNYYKSFLNIYQSLRP